MIVRWLPAFFLALCVFGCGSGSETVTPPTIDSSASQTPPEDETGDNEPTLDAEGP